MIIKNISHMPLAYNNYTDPIACDILTTNYKIDLYTKCCQYVTFYMNEQEDFSLSSFKNTY